MKTHKVLLLALVVSALLAVSVEAGDRHRNNGRSQAAPAKAQSSSHSFSSGSGFRSGGSRTIGSSHHFSSMGARSMPSQRFAPTSAMLRRGEQRSGYSSSRNVASFSQRRFTPRTFNRSNGVARLQSNRNFGTIQDNQRFSSLGNSNRNFNRTGTANRFARSENNRNRGTIQGTGGNRFSNNNRGFNHTGTGNHVFARRSAGWHRDWDRRSDHWWNGHRCRFVNGSWFIFDFGFVPWYGWSYYDSYPYDYYYPYGYGGYGYGAYSYDPGVYDQSNYYDQGGYDYNDQSNYYDQGANPLGSSEQSAAVTVADVQDQLTRAGYYHGKIDGVLGPETHHALLSYQSDKGLRMTGSLTTETQQSLGLAAQGGDQITDQ
jgi:putative peptidoglycan binding protein